jgi:O-antigen ligase
MNGPVESRGVRGVFGHVATRQEGLAGTWAAYSRPSLFLWLALWFALNSGPWVLTSPPQGLLGWAHWVRTALPLLVFPLALVAVGQGRGSSGLPGPLKLWRAYGIVGLAACIVAPNPIRTAYWAVCYLAAFAVVDLHLRHPSALQECARLNYVSLLVNAAFLTVMVSLARESLLAESPTGLTAYGVTERMPTVLDMPMSLASGLGRFAGPPAIAAFVLAFTASGWKRIFWAAVSLASAALVYLVQSRGATASLVFGLGLVMLFLGPKARVAGLVTIALAGLAVVAGLVPGSTVDRILEHLLRTRDPENLMTMSGRTSYWHEAWPYILKSPIWGWGPQSDRWLGIGHIHDAYLYALLQAGVIGLGLYVAGLVWTWWHLIMAVRSKVADRLGQRQMLVIAAGILGFFTVRSIPEVSGAMFAVDLMVMLPAMAYISLLAKEGNRS